MLNDPNAAYVPALPPPPPKCGRIISPADSGIVKETVCAKSALRIAIAMRFAAVILSTFVVNCDELCDTPMTSDEPRR
jgi:hypothetical protein